MSRILHLGVGNFHRAHQAWYTDKAGGWDITGVSLRSRTMPDALNAQDGAYTLVIRDQSGPQFEAITAIKQVLFAPENPQAVLDAVADPATHIVTLTITEKGYALDPGDAQAVKNGGLPASALGYLACGLSRRAAPMTVISCDNLTSNGDSLRDALRAFCEAADLRIAAPITYPNSMVDRITPATTDALRREVLQATNWADQVPVETETFSEWVVEDAFAGPRPDWHKVGVQIVKDAAPFELRKLRLLNGAHSALAYAGTLAGYEFVHQAVADPALRGLAQGIFTEAGETLPDGLEFAQYGHALLERFANPTLKHRLRQIAMDGTQKLPVRLLGTIKARGGDAPWCRKGVEAWMGFALAETEAGRLLDDPKAGEIAQACGAENPQAALAALIGYDA